MQNRRPLTPEDQLRLNVVKAKIEETMPDAGYVVVLVGHPVTSITGVALGSNLPSPVVTALFRQLAESSAGTSFELSAVNMLPLLERVRRDLVTARGVQDLQQILSAEGMFLLGLMAGVRPQLEDPENREELVATCIGSIEVAILSEKARKAEASREQN